ncbi:uncharacterized protein DS421_2g43580 [Arachis hypogaea]|nr:uncharacterized protein DS421_2g43580 [Arachis hypogaea]
MAAQLHAVGRALPRVTGSRPPPSASCDLSLSLLGSLLRNGNGDDNTSDASSQ